MTRLGRYKTIGVVGMSVTTAGMFLLSRMGISTSYALVVVNMMVVGVGLGMTLPVFNLAVQNAVDVAQVGVATSSVQFLRSIGGSLGTAVFGAVMSNRFGSAFQEALPREVASRIPAATLAAGIVFAWLVIDVPLRQSNASRAPAVEGV